MVLRTVLGLVENPVRGRMFPSSRMLMDIVSETSNFDSMSSAVVALEDASVTSNTCSYTEWQK